MQVISGCLEEGVEKGCYVVKDRRTGRTYNVMFPGRKPDIGMGFRAAGQVERNQMTTCQQGEPFRVQSWQTMRLRCGGVVTTAQGLNGTR